MLSSVFEKIKNNYISIFTEEFASWLLCSSSDLKPGVCYASFIMRKSRFKTDLKYLYIVYESNT